MSDSPDHNQLPKCTTCRETIKGEWRRIAGEIHCDDCYFMLFSAVLEQHPPKPTGHRIGAGGLL